MRSISGQNTGVSCVPEVYLGSTGFLLSMTCVAEICVCVCLHEITEQTRM